MWPFPPDPCIHSVSPDLSRRRLSQDTPGTPGTYFTTTLGDSNLKISTTEIPVLKRGICPGF